MSPALDNILSVESKESLKRLELLARKTVEGLLHGPHESRRLGVSVEFDHHKLYQQGDSIRHIDWRASAKHDQLYIKRFREDTCLNVHLMLDLSASMSNGVEGHLKETHAKSLAACLAYLITRQSDRIALMALADGVFVQQRLGSSGVHMVQILNLLVTHEAQGKDDMHQHLHTLVEQNLARGIIVFISDLMYEPQEIQRELSKLHHQGHEVIVINVRSGEEETFPFHQWVKFTDPEDVYKPTKIDTILLRTLYLEEYESLMREWEAWGKAQDIDLITSRAHEGPEDALLHYIDRRVGMGRR